APEDVATAVVEAALAPPANGTIEVGGPEKFHLDELVARVLEYDKDPGKDAKLGSTKFDWWLENVAPPPKKSSSGRGLDFQSNLILAKLSQSGERPSAQ